MSSSQVFMSLVRGVTEFLWLGRSTFSPYFPSPFPSLYSPSLFNGKYFEITDPRWTFAFSGRCRTAERSTVLEVLEWLSALKKKLGCKTAQSKIVSLSHLTHDISEH